METDSGWWGRAGGRVMGRGSGWGEGKALDVGVHSIRGPGFRTSPGAPTPRSRCHQGTVPDPGCPWLREVNILTPLSHFLFLLQGARPGIVLMLCFVCLFFTAIQFHVLPTNSVSYKGHEQALRSGGSALSVAFEKQSLLVRVPFLWPQEAAPHRLGPFPRGCPCGSQVQPSHSQQTSPHPAGLGWLVGRGAGPGGGGTAVSSGVVGRVQVLASGL